MQVAYCLLQPAAHGGQQAHLVQMRLAHCCSQRCYSQVGACAPLPLLLNCRCSRPGSEHYCRAPACSCYCRCARERALLPLLLPAPATAIVLGGERYCRCCCLLLPLCQGASATAAAAACSCCSCLLPLLPLLPCRRVSVPPVLQH